MIIDHIGLTVSDYETAKRFFVQALGLSHALKRGSSLAYFE
jgi:catechol 2,3-dioxygenase-like lactoylglutathione lyase family enzyme